MQVRAIVFDFDGVIVDSEPAHCNAIEAALAQIGLGFPGKANYARYIGRGDRECLGEVALEQGRSLDKEAMDRLVRLKAEAFMTACRSGTIPPYTGTLEVLRAAARLVPVAVCSGSQRESVMPVLESLELVGHLTTIVTATDVKRNKPNPDPYLLAAERLRLDPGECVAVEDSPTGIRSARAAGYTVHAICHSFRRDALGEAHHIHECCTALSVNHLLAAHRRP